MHPDLQWLAGFVVAIIGIVGGVIMRDRQIMDKITQSYDRVNDRMSQAEDRLNERITKVQQDYVRRDDVKNAMSNFESSINQMREELRETNRRIDMFLASLTKKD